ncbi:MAG: hypothetical protein IJR73_07855, partial [Bacteroidales bacterium]|nr:hypothetical protein [Bacteroidales bacterium]
TKQAVTISISDTSLVMAPHDYRSLTASAKAADGSEVGVIWSMDRTGVVTVDGNVVIATDGGQVVVTATAADGSGLSASCTILVLEAIDLGLSIRWASMNIGAKGPEDYGDYFAWGETAPKENSTYYSWNYYDDSKYTEDDRLTVLEQSDDAACVNWGGRWRMPTSKEFSELVEKCTWTWGTQNNVNGYWVNGPNGNSIFLPAVGYHFGGSAPIGQGAGGGYWSSTLCTNDNVYGYGRRAWFLDINQDWNYTNLTQRCYGLPIRPVCP